MNAFEKRILKKFDEIPLEVTPGFHLLAFEGDDLIADVQWRKTWRYYDLASLTKALFTGTAFMKALDDKKYLLNEKVCRRLSWFKNQQITIQQLMNHSSGIQNWHPFYEKIRTDEPVQDRWIHLKDLLNHETEAKVGTCIYSDLNLLYLGYILETCFDMPLIDIWNELFNSSPVFGGMHFNVENKPVFERSQYAPTENCAWRKRVIQGEVHDENAWALGGFAPHSGLFGTAYDVAHWLFQYRNAVYGEPSEFPAGSKTAKLFSRRSLKGTIGDWALLFMMPTPGGRARCGTLMGFDSIGYLGFTGTSFWWDPVQDRSVILLSNRIHPTRERKEFLEYRTWIHTHLWEIWNQMPS